MEISRTRLLALSLLAAAACTDPPAPTDGGAADAGSSPDAAARDASAGASVEVGTGALAFTPFAELETLDVVAGCQGLQHIWISLRVTGIDRIRPTIRMRLVRDRDGLEVSTPFETRVDLLEVPGQPHDEVVGLTLIVPEPDLAIGEELTVEVTITDEAGASASGARRIRARMGPPAC